MEPAKIEKMGASGQKLSSPLLTKRTPKFYNTLKKNAVNQNLVNSENEHHLVKHLSKTKKKSNILIPNRTKSIILAKEEAEDFGFVKNKVEIIKMERSPNIKRKGSQEKENTLRKLPIKGINFHKDENNLLKELSNNRPNSKISIPTIASISIDNIQKNKSNDIKNQQNLHNEDNLDKIFKELGVTLNNLDKKNIQKDKNIVNNLTILSVIQKNLTEIAQRKKEYLTEILLKKSLSIDSNLKNELFRKDEDDIQSIQQPPMDDLTNKILSDSNKNYNFARSHSVCSVPKSIEPKEKKEPKTRRKLTTIDFDEVCISQNSTINPKRTDGNDNQQSINSTAMELLRMLSIKHISEQNNKNKIYHNSSFSGEEEEKSGSSEKERKTLMDEHSFLREFVINYPLSKKRTNFKF